MLLHLQKLRAGQLRFLFCFTYPFFFYLISGFLFLLNQFVFLVFVLLHQCFFVVCFCLNLFSLFLCFGVSLGTFWHPFFYANFMRVLTRFQPPPGAANRRGAAVRYWSAGQGFSTFSSKSEVIAREGCIFAELLPPCSPIERYFQYLSKTFGRYTASICEVVPQARSARGTRADINVYQQDKCLLSHECILEG